MKYQFLSRIHSSICLTLKQVRLSMRNFEIAQRILQIAQVDKSRATRLSTLHEQYTVTTVEKREGAEITLGTFTKVDDFSVVTG